MRQDSFRNSWQTARMLETSARLLRLLALLQTRRDWTSTELAERLGVSTRTVRTDIEKLRGLDYPVHARPGVAGGYRLGAGAKLPPLLLDDDEAVAVVVGLRTAAGGTVTGIEETSIRALAKLEQVLPSRLRHRVSSIAEATVPIPASGPQVDVATLTVIAAACRDRERLRFDYRGHNGDATRRDVEPHRLVHGGRRWYLVAWDVDRRDWRTFRADRIEPKTPNGPRFEPRTVPAGDVADFVSTGVSTATWAYRARVLVHSPAEAMTARLPKAVKVTPIDDESCEVAVGSDSPQQLAVYLGMLGADFHVLDAPELEAECRALAQRYARAAG